MNYIRVTGDPHPNGILLPIADKTIKLSAVQVFFPTAESLTFKLNDEIGGIGANEDGTLTLIDGVMDYAPYYPPKTGDVVKKSEKGILGHSHHRL